MMTIFHSFLMVALTEMGDKTQLLAFVLASRFKKPGSVLLGILVATILNHVLAATVGNWVAQAISEIYLKWILGLCFISFGIWILVPDQDESKNPEGRYGAFFTTLFVFFLAEMGDKTQLSTVALAAKYESVFLVTVGTTLGMMFSDGLAVIFGKKIAEKISMVWVRRISSLLFFIFGVGILVGY